MYKIELIDDEYNNIKLLTKLVKWQEVGFEIVGDASDGKDGLELYKKLLPDVVVVDIKMPIMDGLECIRQIRKINQDVVLIVLSAFGEFEYAQESMRYGVYTYILKPINRVQLTEMLLELRLHLDQKHSQHLIVQKLQSDAVINEFNQLLFQCLDCNESIIAEKKIMELLPNDEYLVITCKSTLHDTQINNSDISSEQIKLFQKFLNDKKIVTPYSFFDAKYGGLLITQWPLSQKIVSDKISELLFEQKDKIKDIIIFKKSFDMHTIKSTMEECLQFVSPEFYSQDSSVTTVPIQGVKSSYSPLVFSISEADNHVIKSVANNDAVYLLNFLTQVFVQAKVHKSNPQELKDFCFDILLSLKRQLTVCYSDVTFESLRSIRQQMIDEFFRCDKLENYMVKLVCNTFLNLNSLGGMDRTTAILYAATEFTKNSYMRLDFSVQMVAEYVNLSKNYFLKLYKDVHKKNFWDYVSELRINYAVQLLKTTDKTLNEISLTIGYESEYHFIRKFKQFSGQTPAQFRRIAKNAHENQNYI